MSTARITTTFKDTGRVPNVVNLAKLTPATHLNVQETENIIFDGAQAAVARINLDGAPSPRALDAMQAGNADILDLQLVTLGS